MLCNGVLRANGAGSGTRGTEGNAASRISRDAPKRHRTPGKRVWNKRVGSRWLTRVLQGHCYCCF